jgi:hypothetical protein
MFAHKSHRMSNCRSTTRLLLIFSLTVGIWCAHAQVYYATLVGTVRDASGAIVPSADVTATETTTGIRFNAVANAIGDYRIDNLRPGQYSISVSKSGFKTKIANDLTLYVSQTSRIDVQLELGTATQTVMVTSTAPLVQTETADRGSILSDREIESMPLNTRNVMELTYLTPGAQANSTYFNEPMVSVNGRGVYDNQFNIDGGGITSAYMNIPVERPSIDSIQEFKIETSNMSAEYGLHSGGVVTIATKHGTNEFHGTLFEFFRNDQLNARNFFDSDRPPLRYNQFGGNIGGPILKNKLFFFFSYEGARERRSQPFLSTVPTLAERQGNFALGTGAKDAQIFNPYDVSAAGLRAPFPNNQIPASMFNKVALNYLSIFPLPNRNGFPNYYFSSSGINDFDRYSGRLDWNPTSKDTLIGRFGRQSNPAFTPGPLPGADLGTRGNLLDGTDMQITWNHLVSSASLNQFRFSFANLNQSQVPSDFYGKAINSTLGFEVPPNLDPFVTGCPWVSFSGVSTTGVCQNAINTFPNKTFYLSDDYSYRHGVAYI